LIDEEVEMKVTLEIPGEEGQVFLHRLVMGV